MATNLEIAGLLEESGWLRALAASLIADGAQADDLVQDTWLAALRRPPRSASHPRPWLARVARNLARNTRRERTRRQAREEFVAEERAHPGPDALAQQAEVQRLLAEAVTRLAEPLRAVIVLRYFQGLDSSAAAARLGLPASTVRTRLQRALEELRADLDRRFEGGRAGWGLVLAPLARGAGTAPATSTATAATLGPWSPAALASAAGVCALATAGAFYFATRSDPELGERALAALPSMLDPVAGQTQAPVGGRAPLPPTSEEAASSPMAEVALTAATERAADAGVVLGGTILVDGRAPEWPIVLTLEPTIPPVPSGDTSPRPRMRRDVVTIPPEQQGKFAFGQLPPSWNGRLVVSDFPFADGGYALAIDAPRADLVLALHSGPAIVGRIRDAEGRAVGGLEGEYQLRLGHAGEPAKDITTQPFVCRADGRFRIRGTDRYEWGSLTLRVEAEGLGFLHLDTPDFAPAGGCDLGELSLEPAHALEFTVRDPLGAPIEGAFARVESLPWSRRSAGTDAEGKGRIAFAPDREVSVRVSAGGYADQVGTAPLVGALEVVLEPLATLDLALVGSLPDQADRVRVSAARSAFVWDGGRDHDGWDDVADVQVELGGSRFNVLRGPFPDDGHVEYEFALLRYGRLRLTGLVPDVPLTIEALAPDGRVLATAAASVASQTRATLELGDPRTAGAEPTEKVPMRRTRTPR